MAKLAIEYKKRIIELEDENQNLKNTLESIAAEGDDCIITSNLAADIIDRAKEALVCQE